MGLKQAIDLFFIMLLYIGTMFLLGATLGGGGGGGGHTVKEEGASLTQRSGLNCTGAGISCTDDSANNETDINVSGLGFTPPANLYVCSAAGAPCNCSDSNDGTSQSATVCTLQGALSKIAALAEANSTIHVATGTYSTGSTSVTEEDIHYAYPNTKVTFTARTYIDHQALGTKFITIRGYINSAANSFADASLNAGCGADTNCTANTTGTNGWPTDGTAAYSSTSDESNLNDTARSWTANQFSDYWVRLTGGTGFDATDDENNWYLLKGNGTTSLQTIGRWRGSTPNSTTTYKIYNPASMPQFSGTGVDACMYFSRARNIKVKFIYCNTGATGSKRSIGSTGSDGINFFGSRIGGQNRMIRGKYQFVATNLDADGFDEGIVCGGYANCFFAYTGIQDFVGNLGSTAGVRTNMSQVFFNDSFVRSTVTTAASGSTGVWIDSLSRIDASYTRLSPSQASSDQNALWISDGHAFLHDRVDIGCYNATASKGLTLTSKSYAEFDGLNSTVRVCTIGLDIKSNSVYASFTTPTFDGSTRNKQIDATGVDIGDGSEDYAFSPPFAVTMFSPAGTAIIWTNMPSAVTDFLGNRLTGSKLDLTQFTQARLVARISVACSSAAQISAQYSIDADVNYSYLDGSTGPSITCDSTGTKVGSWVYLVDAARADVLTRVAGSGGNGVADPSFGTIVLQLR